jgi:hypothetical protein
VPPLATEKTLNTTARSEPKELVVEELFNKSEISQSRLYERVFHKHKSAKVLFCKSESRLGMELDDYRNKDGDLSRKHGNTLIGTLRSHYGSDFAAGCSESDRLTDVLDQLDEGSLNKLTRDYEANKLAGIFPN